MPIVKPSNNTILKVSLSDSVVEELTAYAEWAGATRARVVRTALQRLFNDDVEWRAHKKAEESSDGAST